MTLVPLAGDVPPVVRLRALLKAALRAWGWKCTDCREVKREQEEGSDSC